MAYCAVGSASGCPEPLQCNCPVSIDAAHVIQQTLCTHLEAGGSDLTNMHIMPVKAYMCSDTYAMYVWRCLQTWRMQQASLDKGLVVQLLTHGLPILGLLPECISNLTHWDQQLFGTLHQSERLLTSLVPPL